MLKKSAVLKWEKTDTTQGVQLIWLDDKSIPDTLNGETGFHIYHVRILTELILQQLKEQGASSLSDEDIEAIATAATLHDIGKSKIPGSILNSPSKLSPVEYDIVKKHAELGEAIIRELDFGDIDPRIRRYAAEIALFHHERYDGTGYPHGLKGEDIPLAAQVVSLVDSYDALTSSRSYKEAFSQDVALQMISSGMCGVFREELVDCLLKVINHSSLAALRETLARKRSVIHNNAGIIPRRVLFIGNTQYITKDFIDNTFPHSKVMVIGNTELGSAERIKLFRIKKPSIKAVLETYNFDLIVFFSGDLTYQTSEKSDSGELREVLKYASELQNGVMVLYLSSPEAAFSGKTDRAILSAAKENLCTFYATEAALDIKIVQIPYLYSGQYEQDFLYRIFNTLHQQKPYIMEVSPLETAHFISLSDLSLLLIRLVDNWNSGSGTLTIGNEFSVSFADLAQEIEKLCGGKIEFCRTLSANTLTASNKALRNDYGWFARISILEDLEEEYEKFLILKQEKNTTLRDRLKQWITKHSVPLKILELILLFLLCEFLLHLTDSAVLFSLVDFRMAYIVLIATSHGINYGLAASGLSSVSWLIAKVVSGTNIMTIFYEPTNWLPFIFYVLIGALCGYVKLRKEDTIRFIKEQNRLLEDKLSFTREIYEDAYREKQDLKKQIIGSKDSFGKIYDIARKLDTVELHMLYLRIMDTFEEILENKTVAVYSINDQRSFGRLEVASRDILPMVSRSISLETYAPILDSVGKGEIWRNIDLKPEFPMFAAGIYRGDDLVMLLFLWQTSIEQRSLYYVNLFKILRDLVQMSLLRAFDYSQAIHKQRYIENTHILNADAFRASMQNIEALAEKKVSSYLLLEFDSSGHSYSELEELLYEKIRTNDLMGAADDGRIRLLLSGASEADLPAILPRFENTGLPISVIQ